MRINRLFIVILSIFISSNIEAFQTNSDEYMYGADISFLPELRELEISTYDEQGEAKDLLSILKDEGFNTVRVRIWVDPDSLHSGFDEVLAFTNEIKELGLQVFLNIHYSDHWADPGKQNKPTAWESLSFEELNDSVYAYTARIISAIEPEFVQIGNEINGGFLWPDGNYDNREQFKTLLSSGIQAVRDNSPETEIVLHYAGYSYANTFFFNLVDLDFDIIALSYYPFWHGKNLEDLELTIQYLSSNFRKRVIIAEIAYPFDELDYTSDYLVEGFAPTPQGQLDFVNHINSMLLDLEHGFGMVFWGGVTDAYKIPKPLTEGFYWENQALLDYENRALPILSLPSLHPVSNEFEAESNMEFRLRTYPNPFNPTTTVSFQVERSGKLELEVYNLLGQKLLTVYSGFTQTGSQQFRLDMLGQSSGVYIVKATMQGETFTQKILLLK